MPKCSICNRCGTKESNIEEINMVINKRASTLTICQKCHNRKNLFLASNCTCEYCASKMNELIVPVTLYEPSIHTRKITLCCSIDCAHKVSLERAKKMDKEDVARGSTDAVLRMCGNMKCKVVNEKMLKCGKCKLFYYCSKECQKMDWKEFHKDDCCKRFEFIMDRVTV